MIRSVLMFTLFLLLACSSPSSVNSYVVFNSSGPAVSVVVNGSTLTRLTCGSPGIDLLDHGPALPWDIVLLRDNGSILGAAHVSSVSGSRSFVVRGESAYEGSVSDLGGPLASPTCPPSAT